MVLELGDTCIAKNEKNGLYCDLEFKTKVLRVAQVKLGITLMRCAPRASFRAHTMLFVAESGGATKKSGRSLEDGVTSWISETPRFVYIRRLTEALYLHDRQATDGSFLMPSKMDSTSLPNG
jgi:hypothetical protein